MALISEEQRERNRECSRKWKARNRAAYLAKKYEWDQANREKVRAQKRCWYARHRAERLAYMADRYAANPEKFKAKVAANKSANPEKSAASKKSCVHRRRARLLGSKSPGVRPAEWRLLVELFGGCCAYCGKPGREIDHIVPISKGGIDEMSNVLPACSGCNMSKSAKDIARWLGQRGFEDPRKRLHVSYSDCLRRGAQLRSRVSRDSCKTAT
jgi:5-methylcytosine-specific restriction endonuclease McrA